MGTPAYQWRICGNNPDSVFLAKKGGGEYLGVGLKKHFFLNKSPGYSDTTDETIYLKMSKTSIINRIFACLCQKMGDSRKSIRRKLVLVLDDLRVVLFYWASCI